VDTQRRETSHTPSPPPAPAPRRGRAPSTGRQLRNVPLPGLNLPDSPEGVNSELQERLSHAATVSTYWRAVRKFRKQVAEYHRATAPPYQQREIVVRFVVGQDRVGCVVDWRNGGVGSAGLLRRVAGPLRVNARTVRSLGPGVALHVLLGALGDVTKDL
jgi:hypothetical protein